VLLATSSACRLNDAERRVICHDNAVRLLKVDG
jgi:predicted TIM-barrel fold metal-dependent hydrolase